MTSEESLKRAEELLDRLEKTRARLEATSDPDEALEVLAELAEIAKQVEAEIARAKREGEGEGEGERGAGLDELRELVDAYLLELALTPELGGLEESLRYALGSGGKRIRPVLCVATGEAADADAERLLPAAGAVELVHTFSLVHDDLPALDDDDERRGRPSAHVRFGEATAILAGDALLAEAFRLAASYETTAVARELVAATLGMIGGQYLDVVERGDELERIHRLKTGCLFDAAVGCALWAAGVPESEQAPWRAFGSELGLLFQAVDDILDGDGLVIAYGAEGARAVADGAAERARERLETLGADTSVLGSS